MTRRPTAAPVDRTSARWQRIRSACSLAADYIDLDTHADRVWLDLQRFHTQQSTGGARTILGGSSASTPARRVTQ